jgi:uncharacterized membrane protein YraQ (UPF0718 family)
MNGTLLAMAALLAALAALAWQRGGQELVAKGLGDGWGMLVQFGPLVALSFLAAAFAGALIPAQWVRDALGESSGLRGIAIATGAGILTPAGPYTSMPIAAVMLKAGAGVGPVVAFLTGWALVALHRLVAWEIPILGLRLALLRYAISLAVPLLAGLAARALAGGPR